MKWLRNLAVILLCALPLGASGYWQSRSQVSVGTAAYVGPGDIVSGALFWVGFRGYNAAFSGNVAELCDAATGLVCVNASWAGSTLTIPTVSGLICGSTINCVVSQLYDQTGNGFNFVQGTLANMPAFTLNAFGSLPGMTFNGTTSSLNSSASTSQAQPFTLSTVYNQNGASGNSIFAAPSGDVEFNGGTDVVLIYAGSSVSRAATNGSPHAVQAIVNNASSSIEVDGGQTTGTAGTNVPIVDTLYLGSFNGAAFFWPGKIAEFGMWGSAFNGTQISNMNSNQHSYYGF